MGERTGSLWHSPSMKRRDRMRSFLTVYVRKSSFLKGWFVLIDGKNDHDGAMQDVAGRFLMGDRYLKNKGFVRMRFSNPSNLTAFEL
jgi:hypothetical protein